MVFVFAALMMAAPEPEQAPAPRMTRKTVAEITEQLRSSNYQIRQQATETLSKLPATHRDLVQSLRRQSHDPEVTSRLDHVVRLLEERHLENPPRVNYRARNQTAYEAIEQIVHNSGGLVIQVGKKQLLPRKDHEFRDLPFWEVLDRLGDEAGCNITIRDDLKPMFLLHYDDCRAGHVYYHGPLRVQATGYGSHRSYPAQPNPYSRSGNSNSCWLHLDVRTEPQTMIAGRCSVEPIRSRDEENRIHHPVEVQRNNEIRHVYSGEQGTYGYSQFCTCQPPHSADSKLLRELEIDVHVGLKIGFRDALVCENLSQVKALRFQHFHRTYEIDSIVVAPGQMQLSLHRVAQGYDLYSYTNDFQVENFVVTNEQGEALSLIGFQLSRDSRSGVPNLPSIQRYTFQAPKSKSVPKRLVIREPIVADTVRKVILRDIPVR